MLVCIKFADFFQQSADVNSQVYLAFQGETVNCVNVKASFLCR